MTQLSTHLIPNLFVGYDYGCSLVYVKQLFGEDWHFVLIFQVIVQDISQLPLDLLTASAFQEATQEIRIAHGLLRFLKTKTLLSCLLSLMFTRVQILEAARMIIWK